MPTPFSQRVQKRRDALRAAGLRPVQIWVPDTRRPGFEAECRRQAALVAQADHAEDGLNDFMDAALVDVYGVYPNKGTKCDIGLSLISDAHDCLPAGFKMACNG